MSCFKLPAASSQCDCLWKCAINRFLGLSCLIEVVLLFWGHCIHLLSMKNIKDLLETIDSYLSLYKLFHFCTCTEIIYGCLSTEHEAQPAICGHDIGLVGPFLSNRNVFRVVIAFFNTRRVGRIRDSYSNPRRNAPNPSSVYIRLCKYRKKKIFYWFYN